MPLPGPACEHGLAYWIEADGKYILMDTGQGPALEQNVPGLGIYLGATDVVVLSCAADDSPRPGLALPLHRGRSAPQPQIWFGTLSSPSGRPLLRLRACSRR